MTALNLESFEAALKVHYTDLRVKNLVYRNNPFLAAVPKYEYFGGKNLPIPVQFGTPQGRSATFTDANNQNVQTPGEYTDFVLKRVRNYSVAAIDNETLEASFGRANAFMVAAASCKTCIITPGDSLPMVSRIWAVRSGVMAAKI